MPPTPQAVQIAGQKQNQQQYDPSKGPPVQNAASLHTPPPQLPGRMAQGALPIAGLPMALSQAQLVETAQPGGQLQTQVKVPAGGSVLAAVNPHTQIQAQLQQQMQPALHLQLQPQQQQQSQAILQGGQAVRISKNVNIFHRVCHSHFKLSFTFSFLYRQWHLLVPPPSRTPQFREL